MTIVLWHILASVFDTFVEVGPIQKHMAGDGPLNTPSMLVGIVHSFNFGAQLAVQCLLLAST